MMAAWKAVALAAIVTLVTQTASAEGLFVNPGFETGGFAGWTVTFSGGNDDGILTGLPVTATGGGTGHEDAVAVPLGWGTDPYTGAAAVEKVVFGNYSARIGDANNRIDHAGTGGANDDPFSVTLRQTATLTQPLLGVQIAWMAAVTEPANREDHEHGFGIGPCFPEFSVLVTNDTTAQILLSETHSSQEGIGPGFWEEGPDQRTTNDVNNLALPTRDPTTPGTWFYHDWDESGFSLLGVPLGTQISITLSVQDCGLRGHPAYARLDVLEIPPGPPEVPEAGTVVLLAVGLALAGWRARRRRLGGSSGGPAPTA